MEQMAMTPLATEMKEWFRQQFQETREASEELVENNANRLTKTIGRVLATFMKRQTSDLSKEVQVKTRQIQETSRQDASRIRTEMRKLREANIQTQQIQRRTRKEISQIRADFRNVYEFQEIDRGIVNFIFLY